MLRTFALKGFLYRYFMVRKLLYRHIESLELSRPYGWSLNPKL